MSLTTVCLKIHEEDKEYLEKLCQADDRTLSWFLRHIVTEWISADVSAKRRSPSRDRSKAA